MVHCTDMAVFRQSQLTFGNIAVTVANEVLFSVTSVYKFVLQCL